MIFQRTKNQNDDQEHEWTEIYAGRWGTVERCLDCGEFQTTMLDLSTGVITTVPGNLLVVAFANFFIITGTEEEFKEACGLLLERMDITEDQVKRLWKPEQIEGWQQEEKRMPPIIFVYGTWWEHEVVQSETVRKALNGWL